MDGVANGSADTEPSVAAGTSLVAPRRAGARDVLDGHVARACADGARTPDEAEIAKAAAAKTFAGSAVPRR
ncbi:MAG: hypothetical protein WAL35_08725 [Acidimicrobiales bacterium]